MKKNKTLTFFFLSSRIKEINKFTKETKYLQIITIFRL